MQQFADSLLKTVFSRYLSRVNN